MIIWKNAGCTQFDAISLEGPEVVGREFVQLQDAFDRSSILEFEMISDGFHVHIA